MPNQIRGTSQIIADTIPFTIYKSDPVILTDAQIKALPTTAIEVVPGIESMIIFPIFWTALVDNTGGAYTTDPNASWNLMWSSDGNTPFYYASSILFPAIGASPNIYWQSTVGPEISIPHTGFLDDFIGDCGSANAATLTAILGSGLYLKDDYDGVENYTDGNAANTAKITVYYGIIEP